FPQIAGTPVLLTATSTCGAPPPLFKFWVRTPDLVWHMVQDYSSTNTYNWTTLNTQIGSYILAVWVKNTGSLGAYDNLASIPYSMQFCTVPTLTDGTGASYPSGAGPLTLTANAGCMGGAQYSFWYKDPAGAFHPIQAYSAANTAIWNADFKAGA